MFLNLRTFLTTLPSKRLVIQGRSMCCTTTILQGKRNSAPNNSGSSQFKTRISGFKEFTRLLNFQIAMRVSKMLPYHCRPIEYTSQVGSTRSGPLKLIGTSPTFQPRLLSSFANKFIDLSAPPPVNEFVTIKSFFTLL